MTAGVPTKIVTRRLRLERIKSADLLVAIGTAASKEDVRAADEFVEWSRGIPAAARFNIRSICVTQECGSVEVPSESAEEEAERNAELKAVTAFKKLIRLKGGAALATDEKEAIAKCLDDVVVAAWPGYEALISASRHAGCEEANTQRRAEIDALQERHAKVEEALRADSAAMHIRLQEAEASVATITNELEDRDREHQWSLEVAIRSRDHLESELELTREKVVADRSQQSRARRRSCALIRQLRQRRKQLRGERDRFYLLFALWNNEALKLQRERDILVTERDYLRAELQALTERPQIYVCPQRTSFVSEVTKFATSLISVARALMAGISRKKE